MTYHGDAFCECNFFISQFLIANTLTLLSFRYNGYSQKVCTEGIADSNDPKTVNLDIVGLDIMGDDNINAPENGFFDILDPSSIIRKIGPIELRGIIQSFPFGKFRILYLDDELRIIRTNQGYVAVNLRLSANEEWF